MADTTVIDEDRIRELENDFGAEDVGEIIEAFLEEATEVVDALRTMTSDAPSSERAAQFHFLAGSAHNMGAVAFGTLAKQLEVENGSFSDEDYAAFRAQYQRVLDNFQGAEQARAAG